MTLLLAAGVGVLVGVVVGTLGAGGGILSLPILVYALGMDPHSAATASLVIVGSTSLVSLIPHARHGNVQWAKGVVFGLLGVVGAVGGARLAALVPPNVLMALLAVLLLAVAAIMLRRSYLSRRLPPAALDGSGRRPRSSLAQLALVVVAATMIGLLTGFFGVGGGFMVVPALLLVMRVNMRVAVGTSLLVIVVNTTLGLLGRVGQSFDINWAGIAIFALASMLGGLLGGRFSSRARPQTLVRLFGLLLLVVAVATAAQAIPALLEP